MLSVKVVQDTPDVTLLLEGELDLGTGDLLREAVARVDLTRAASITFSLDGLNFIDSTGVGQLIAYYKSFAERNLPMRLANDNEAIEEVLRLIGVREIMRS
ncbi:MAG TPA: STAS domain-containing protein [Firmicutes bacterium]|nr:STAS domain-containing protein [Bacillota bacterium]